MDPQLRKLLEVAYEAWMDSGINHLALRGSERVRTPARVVSPAACVTRRENLLVGQDELSALHPVYATRDNLQKQTPGVCCTNRQSLSSKHRCLRFWELKLLCGNWPTH